ncbi:MAG: hypothetical protein HRU19_03705 [Pseudobacteriovorax sp.]|nr:hypothetical protein [Pseudobacteriovorax sp.]
MKYLFTCFVLCFVLPLMAKAQSFVEDNPALRYQVTEEESNISEEQFYEVIETALEIYTEIIEEQGWKPLTIRGFWEDETVNAYILPQLQKNIVTMYGGLARRPEVSLDGFALVVCHEIAHGYGGKPDKRSPLFKVSVEGQADYYGAGVCLPKVLDAIPITDFAVPTSYERFLCENEADPSQCERLVLASRRIGALLAFIKSEPIPQFETPDPSVVRRTLRDHPGIQCRLDTYLAGILNLERPRCWYRP